MNKFWDRIAKIISQITQPPLVIGVFLTFLVFYYAPDTATGFIWLLIAAGLIGFIPTVFTFVAFKLGWISDVLLPERKDRIGPFLVAALGAVITLICFYKMDVPTEILVFLMALILVLMVVLLITTFWKISVHATTITVVTVSINVLTDCQYWYLLFLIPVVMWARVYRKRHTGAQVFAGALINGVIVYAAFKLFGF